MKKSNCKKHQITKISKNVRSKAQLKNHENATTSPRDQDQDYQFKSKTKTKKIGLETFITNYSIIAAKNNSIIV